MPNNTKPICAMVENANIRFRFVCAMAARLPTSNEATASMPSICCQSSAMGNMPSTNKRMTMANAANLGAPAIIRVTAVGAPSYTSGTHMWNGAAPNLKARPATTNTTPKASTRLSALPVVNCCETTATSKEPVAPYIMERPYSMKPLAIAPSTKYFIAASEAFALSRRSATSA